MVETGDIWSSEKNSGDAVTPAPHAPPAEAGTARAAFPVIRTPPCDAVSTSQTPSPRSVTC